MSEREHSHAVANSEMQRDAEIARASGHAAIKLAHQSHFQRVIASAKSHGMSAPNAEMALANSIREPAPYTAPANWP